MIAASTVAHVVWEAMRLIAEDAGQPQLPWEALEGPARAGVVAWIEAQPTGEPIEPSILHREYADQDDVPGLAIDEEPFRLLPRWRRRQFTVAAGIVAAIGAD